MTNSNRARIIQCLQRQGNRHNFGDNTEIAKELAPTDDDGAVTTTSSHNNDPGGSTMTSGSVTTVDHSAPAQQETPEMHNIGDIDRLPTIHEDDAEYDEDAMVIEEFYSELMNEQPLEDDPEFEDYIPYPVEMTPENTVIFSCPTDNNDDTYTEETLVAVDAT